MMVMAANVSARRGWRALRGHQVRLWEISVACEDRRVHAVTRPPALPISPALPTLAGAADLTRAADADRDVLAGVHDPLKPDPCLAGPWSPGTAARYSLESASANSAFTASPGESSPSSFTASSTSEEMPPW